MSKKTNITGYHVRVEPLTSILGFDYHNSPEDQKQNCEGIARMILKHVGKNDDNRGDVTVVPEMEAICENCGEDWTESSDKFNGGCCDEDLENEPKEQVA